MLIVSLVFAAIAAAAHIFFFTLESIRWTEPKTAAAFGLNTPEEIEATRPLALNQGYYNLALAIATLVGGVIALTGAVAVGLAIVITATSVMVVAGVVLRVSMQRMAKASYIQMVPPALAIAFAIAALTIG